MQFGTTTGDMAMRKLCHVACTILCTGATLTATQTPPLPPTASAPPARMPIDIPYGTSIGIDTANRVFSGAEALAKRHDWKMNIAVTHMHGDRVAFERMDGAQLASVTVSWGKARTAARLAKRVSSSINLKAGTLTFC
ncbi:GlcG/HbpS family heme-binding protein [Paraburkholderia nemoris]|nr:heme-binding protein [Paraburkholderia nemoris]